MATGMPMPDWATDEAREQVAEMLDGSSGAVAAMQFNPITRFSTHFGEWIIKEEDVLVHLFPRAGVEDDWAPTRYDDQNNYIAARREEKATVAFPGDMRDRIKVAGDKVWMGDIAIDLVPELGAYAIQFQGAKNTVKTLGDDKFVDTFCEAIDEQLD